MPNYAYKARNNSGKLIENTLEADNQEAAALSITNRGLIPISITETVVNQSVEDQFRQWQALQNLNITDLILFTRQMYSLSKAGVPITRALRSLTDSTRNLALSMALRDITKRLEAGSSLTQAMGHHKKIFNPLFINIINVGETTGGQDQAFLQISRYLEREKETQNRIKTALRYPTMVLVAISVAMIIVNIYVIPAFKGIFDKMHAELPWQTQLLMSISSFMVNYWPHLVIVLLVSAFVLAKYINTRSGRLLWDRLLLRIPAIGSIVERATMERFSRSFAMVFSAGVPLIQGINIVSDAIGNAYIASKLDQMRIGIEKGDTISRMAKNTQLFPPLVIQMIQVGEETGNIGDMLLEVADFYEAEIDAELKTLSSVIEPFLIVVIGIMVLILALGIFLPMWNLSAAMH